MAERVQTYKNHPRLLPAFHFFVLPVLLLNVLNESGERGGTRPKGPCSWWWSPPPCSRWPSCRDRRPLTVQDRVIRLEMRLRLRQILPPELQPRIHDLTHRQLVALRFASDAELPELVREVLDGKLTTGKEIKLRVKNWQADWLRA